MIERKRKHYFISHGHLVSGYGSSMCSHFCGDESEPCFVVEHVREVTEWTVATVTTIGEVPIEFKEKFK